MLDLQSGVAQVQTFYYTGRCIYYAVLGEHAERPPVFPSLRKVNLRRRQEDLE